MRRWFSSGSSGVVALDGDRTAKVDLSCGAVLVLLLLLMTTANVCKYKKLCAHGTAFVCQPICMHLTHYARRFWPWLKDKQQKLRA